MEIIEPKFRCSTRKAIDELVAEYNYPYEAWMQDWPYEIANPKEVHNYFEHYDAQKDEDKKFCLMQMLVQSIENIDSNVEFEKNWIKLERLLFEDYKIHEYTIYYWCCFGVRTENSFRISSKMRECWIKANGQF